MIRGQQVFVEHFKKYKDCYIVIGGVAVDNVMTSENIPFRATKDFDIILVVEALRPEFFNAFWEFIESGKYKRREKIEADPRYYRFTQPGEEDYPHQIELFSKRPDVIKEIKGSHIVPIPADEDISSLSAILMDEDYYKYTKANTKEIEGLTIASKGSLICLKAKAYLDLSERKENGDRISSNDIKKHKNDVFRIGVTLNGEEKFNAPDSVLIDLRKFIEKLENEEPDISGILKHMGLGSGFGSPKILDVIKDVFSIE